MPNLLPLELERIAFHYVDPKQAGPVCSEQELDAAGLAPAIRDFLLGLAGAIWHAPDAGSTRSARFLPTPPPSEAPGAASHEAGQLTDAHQCLQAMLDDPAEFFPASRQLAVLLHARSHPNASPGVLAVLRLTRPSDGRAFIALAKVRHHDEELVRFVSGDLPRLGVEQVQDVLLKDIQKGALIPHPDKTEYDLKVIDAQSRDDPAAYFTEKFLGCSAKRSDDLQVKKLAPALEKFAQEKELPIKVEKLPQVLQELQQQPENVTPAALAQAAESQELFGEDFASEELVEYLVENRLGDLDIPQEQFQSKKKTVRRVIYRFLDPQYPGLEISGPPEAFAHILESQGEQITFKVITSPEGFKFGYQ